MTRVYMSKDVESGFNKPNLFEQSCTAEIEVQVISRRSMGN
jgi:hypothetical protein